MWIKSELYAVRFERILDETSALVAASANDITSLSGTVRISSPIGFAQRMLADAANALLWQKVVLFMGIGVFILFASFWYQKLADKPEQAQLLE